MKKEFGKWLMDINKLLKTRTLVLDGALGTVFQRKNLTEKDFRGETFHNIAGQIKGNNEALSISRPDIVKDIHTQYLEAGADIITTNSFGANRISQADYGMEKYVRELNLASAKIARETADEFTRLTPDKPRFVAGSISPTNKSASISPDVANPALRAITFDELRIAYREQIEALIEGGIDIVLFETCFDTLNLKAGLMAADDAFTSAGKKLPVMVSFTVGDRSGRILSGQTIEAAVASIAHADLLSIGLNCSFGAKDIKPYLKTLSRIAPCYVSAHPNAGLPNSLGLYDETPQSMAAEIREFLDENLVNIIGGCCGTTPEHIRAIAEQVKQIQGTRDKGQGKDELILAGLEPLIFNSQFSILNSFVLIGERCNVAGSRKFLRLIKEQKYDEALEIARKQVDDGAQILDINLDDGLLDGVAEMTNFLNLIAAEPDIARVPVMIDSSDWKVLEAGLKCLQGKSIVNSISLKNGEADFLEKARKIKNYGAAVVAMAFDEHGQADTFERKIEVCTRMYRLLTEKANFKPHDIIFDPNILAIATGIEEHNSYALNFIQATEWIKKNLVGAKVSGGVSNLSFSFRGNNYLREAMHSVFLYHAIRAGMDMGIVNPSTQVVYEDIPEDLRQKIEDVIFNRSVDAGERLIQWGIAEAGSYNDGAGGIAGQTRNDGDWRTTSLEERLQYALIKGVSEYIEQDLTEALTVYSSPVEIIDKPLMGGLNIVGNLFGEGKMFLPQVVKTARTMKRAVAFLQPYIEAGKTGGAAKAGKILMATVKGDVHDIGKNITSVVLSCNNFEVIDIGVMTPAEEIIRQAIENKVDIVGLSGLITPSLQEMTAVAEEMEKAQLTIPLLIGGATTSRLHTALKIAPAYSGAVVQVADASRAVPAATALLNPETKNDYIEKLKTEQQALREKQNVKKELVSLDYARRHPLKIDFSDYIPPKPKFIGEKIIDYIPVKEIIPYIDWAFFLAAWKLLSRHFDASRNDEAQKLLADARWILAEWAANDEKKIKAVIGFYPVEREGDSLKIQCGEISATVPFLRQQEKREDDTYKSLVDFIRPEGDYVGMFVVTAGNPHTHCDCGIKHEKDDYRELLVQTLYDRLAEAAAEYLHERVRKEFWGYDTEKGIRPASGYPSCPDLSLNFLFNDILKPDRIGVSFTPNGAIVPLASVAGFYFAHPQSKYFTIGKIDDEQFNDYAAQKGGSTEDVKKWVGNLL